MQTNILHSVKVLKQEGYDTLDTSPEFLALEAFLYVTGPCRSSAVRTNPLQTILIRTNPYLFRSKPLFIRSAHALTRVVTYQTVSFLYLTETFRVRP